jgi:hypothetical protein
VHRKRSQLAVIDAKGEVLANRNVPNGVEPILKVIGDLPPGTPAAFEAAFGTGWLVELLEGHGFDPHLVHPAVQGDRFWAAWTRVEVLLSVWSLDGADLRKTPHRASRGIQSARPDSFFPADADRRDWAGDQTAAGA